MKFIVWIALLRVPIISRQLHRQERRARLEYAPFLSAKCQPMSRKGTSAPLVCRSLPFVSLFGSLVTSGLRGARDSRAMHCVTRPPLGTSELPPSGECRMTLRKKADRPVLRCCLGLGLWISKQIVDSHHGSIDVKSELGKGSTFTLRLPIQFNQGTETHESSKV